ncbi:hypothetical protein Fmac_006987 [Flemingia macrophylla]|uniref:Uncharacterized protein n=1 Tax=Flemingia macrophylla TaxID=520843 RepID=A0ABD1NC56_9FABA
MLEQLYLFKEKNPERRGPYQMPIMLPARSLLRLLGVNDSIKTTFNFLVPLFQTIRISVKTIQSSAVKGITFQYRTAEASQPDPIITLVSRHTTSLILHYSSQLHPCSTQHIGPSRR